MRNCLRLPLLAQSSVPTLLRNSAAAALALTFAVTAAQAQTAPVAGPQGGAAPGIQSAPPPVGPMPLRDHGDKVALPPSTQRMNMDTPQVDGAIHKTVGQADQRLDDLSFKPGAKMEAPDSSGYKGELDEISEAQRQIRLLELKQKQADLAVKLWSTVYDAKREESEANHLQRAPLNAAPSVAPSTMPSAGPSAAPSGASVSPGAAPEPVVAAGPPPLNPMEPQPKVTSVFGQGKNLTAIVLIPYMGEMTVQAGATLPNGMEVEKVSATGVTVHDSYGRHIPLSFGSAVPQTPPTRSSQGNPGAPVPGGVMF